MTQATRRDYRRPALHRGWAGFLLAALPVLVPGNSNSFSVLAHQGVIKPLCDS
jgi:hypothetical protein